MAYATKKTRYTLLKLLSALLLALTIPLTLLYLSKADALAWYLLRSAVSSDPQSGISLPLRDYRVQIEAQPIIGIDDASGLTYNTDSNTLFSVLNNEPLIIELNLQGEVLRKIKVDGVHDMEGITHMDGSRYAIVDEHDQRIVIVHIDAATERIDTSTAPQLSLGTTRRNKGFEGISWDERNQRLLVVKERNPLQIIEITDFADQGATHHHLLEIKPGVFPGLPLRDLSSVTFHDASQHMVLLSDESKIAIAYDLDGRVTSALALWRGFHGLQRSVPQAEGIAIGPDGTVYVVSEPNLFYTFTK